MNRNKMKTKSNKIAKAYREFTARCPGITLDILRCNRYFLPLMIS
jgi:hypothetical protein